MHILTKKNTICKENFHIFSKIILFVVIVWILLDKIIGNGYNCIRKWSHCVTLYNKGVMFMKGYMSNENGEIIIENEVIAQYAGHAALGCFGIVGMATISMKDGIAKLLKGDSVSKGVNVDIDEDNNLSIDFHIIVAYGVSISAVCDNLVNTVKYSVEEMTGMDVKAINIFVEGVRVID